MRRVMGVAPWGARSSSLPGYLRLNASSRVLFLMFSSVWLGPAPSPVSRPSVSLPLLRSGRGLGLCRLLPLLGAGLAAPCLCGVCSAAPPWAAPPGCAPSLQGVFYPNEGFFQDLAQLIPHELTHVRASPGDCAAGWAQAWRTI